MSEKMIMPFGPQHPVLPEPIHLSLVLQDEKVADVIPSIGFIHRGLEKLVEKKDFQEYTFVAERICGICSYIHGMGYCQAVENIMGLEVPARANFLRVIGGEFSRIHSHTLWLGLCADAFGFESLFMHTWRLREKILDLMEEITGGRVIFSHVKIGGVKSDVDALMANKILDILKELEPEFREITSIFLDNRTVRSRMSGVGALSEEEARKLGAVGPMLRASGVAYDLRTTGYAAYGQLDFEPIVEKDGDCMARCQVRIREIFQSMDLIRQAVGRLPAGPIDVPVKGNPDGEFMARLEQPRGEVVYYVKANGTKMLDRMRVRTPTFANLPPLIQVLKGSDLADVPVLILTIDPCISCTER
ncbi:ech hydrogenase subunit E [Sporobacter termitidis DSM 10068]|uniref:Ech hydrogenase subunit E n=1 Tax=Sporobacter termitidis DSM 10068 TaxID=1123282 RepID=A0A1M5Z0P5_9FIRM|nr:nickel-dependent hydrogenase large subunit [Sporobacter termitidis]SHI17760.1 ech hydrogenase subunit E [Sporobacter termitidis DSM 10068]